MNQSIIFYSVLICFCQISTNVSKQTKSNFEWIYSGLPPVDKHSCCSVSSANNIYLMALNNRLKMPENMNHNPFLRAQNKSQEKDSSLTSESPIMIVPWCWHPSWPAPSCWVPSSKRPPSPPDPSSLDPSPSPSPPPPAVHHADLTENRRSFYWSRFGMNAGNCRKKACVNPGCFSVCLCTLKPHYQSQ